MANVKVTLPKWRFADSNDVLLAAAGALYQGATNIMSESKLNYVPVDTGTLRSSGLVEQPKLEGDRVVVVLGYGGPAAPYALAVHENPRSGKTGGVSPSGQPYKRWARVGQWKYLETPFQALRHTIAPRVAAAVARVRRR